jgi:DNA-binding NarL/FixJ family response regulator
MSKTDEVLTTIPVVILAKSCDESDVFEGFALGAAGYVVKSNDRGRLREQIAVILTYWTMNQVPRTQLKRSRTDQAEAWGSQACLEADHPNTL